MKIIIFLLYFSIVHASKYPSFTNDELEKIKNNSGNIAKNRAIDYIKTMDQLKPFPKKEQIQRVNFYLNQMQFKPDMATYKQNDYWGTPKEFLVCGYGDCEDYAILKYFTLLKLGFDKNRLFITASREKFTGQMHMVLSYFEETDKPPLILDNLSYKILELPKRVDLEPQIFINEEGSYKLDEHNNLTKIGEVPQKFMELLQRVKKES